jgi:O-acetyl-ADP-ribose deacetylase (regulator of RNase III)
VEPKRYCVESITADQEALASPRQARVCGVGLHTLVEALRTHQIRSVAVPALGCGLGGLNWFEVRPLIATILGPLEGVNAFVFEPYHAQEHRVQR